MVHLETKYEYLEKCKEDIQVKNLVNQILKEESIPIIVDQNNASIVAVNLITCIKKNDREMALEIYTQFAKRKPTRESHWIYDEFVVFALLCTVCKFSFDTIWIRDVIHFSSQTRTPELQTINTTFLNILNGNFNVKQDYHQISLVCQHLIKNESYDLERVNKMFAKLWNLPFPFFESTFLNIISIRAIEISFAIKGLLSPQNYFDHQYFIERFFNRTEVAAKICSWFTLLVSAAALYYLLWKVNVTNEKLTSFIISVTGVGVAAIFGLRKKMQDNVTVYLRKIFGYKLI
jgi:hypothetical protein